MTDNPDAPYKLDEADLEELDKFMIGPPRPAIDTPQIGILVSAGYLKKDNRTGKYEATDEGRKRNKSWLESKKT